MNGPIARWAFALFAGCSFACGTTKVQSPVVATQTAPSRHPGVNPLLSGNDGPADGIEVKGLMGTLDPSAVQDTLVDATSAIARCFQREAAARPYLGGQLDAKFRVKRDGVVAQVWLARSTVGNHAIETCALFEFGRTRFPRPSGGGPAEFDYSLTLPSRVGAQALDVAVVRKAFARVAKDLAKLSKPRGLSVTLYIGSDGKLASAGMAAEEPIAKDFATQLMDALQLASFETVSSSVGKVSYSW